jgi:hypothetical protein
MGPQSCKSPNFGNFGTPTWTQCHLDVGLVERHKVYYKGEGGGFPPNPGCGESRESEFTPWFILAPKMFQPCTNQLVVWFCAGLCE